MEGGFDWRRSSPKYVSKLVFAKMMLEQGDKFRVRPIGDLLYGALETEDGFDLYATGSVRWAYTCRFTEAGAGGGTDTVKISPAANSVLRLVSLRVQMCNAGAGRVTNVSVRDEDDGVRAVWGNVTLDDQGVNFPTIGSTAGADNVIDTHGAEITGDGSYLRVAAAALALNEYFDIVAEFEIVGSETRPTVTHTSTGTASTGTPSQDEITVVPT